MRPAFTVLAAVLLAVLPTAIAPTAQAAPAADTLPLAEAVTRLPVAAEDRTGYDREQWECPDPYAARTLQPASCARVHVPLVHARRRGTDGTRWPPPGAPPPGTATCDVPSS